MREEETTQERTLESLVKRASKPNKKITTASPLVSVHSLLSNVFERRAQYYRIQQSCGTFGLQNVTKQLLQYNEVLKIFVIPVALMKTKQTF